MQISYEEYLNKTGESDSRMAWVWWKIMCCGMQDKEARLASYDPEWGWAPLKTR